MRLFNYLTSIFLLVAWACQGAQVPQGINFLENHCLECHDDETAKGALILEHLTGELHDLDHREEWVRIYDIIKSGKMPPPKKSKLSDDQRQAFLQGLERSILQAETEDETKLGTANVRRMNRVEYENTLRDLLHLPLLRVKEMLPEDGLQHGYSKIPSALELSHVQIQKYMEAADVALRQAIVDLPRKPERQKWHLPAVDQYTGRAALAIHAAAPIRDGKLAPELSSVIRGNPVTDWGNTYRSATFKGDADSLVILSGKFGAHQPQGLQPDRYKNHTGGWYKLRFSTWGLRWNRGKIEPAVRSVIRKYVEFTKPWTPDPVQKWKPTPLPEPTVREIPENTEFYGDAKVVHVVRASLKGTPIGFFDAPSLNPTEHEFTVWLEPGEKVSFHVMTLPGTGPANSGVSNGVRSYEGPGVAFDWFEVEGPILEDWPPRSQQRLFGKTPIASFPRPLVSEAPTVGETKAPTPLTIDHFTGAGHKLSDRWYLNVAGEITTKLNFAKPGTYEFQVTAYETPAGEEHAKLYTKLNGREMKHARFQIKGSEKSPQTIQRTFEVHSAGPATLGIEFPNDYFDEQTQADRNLILTTFQVRPVKFSEPSEDQIQTPEPAELLLQFANQAFRRKVQPEEVQPYVEIVNQLLQSGETFLDAMIAGYKAILCSPDFLFLGLEGETATASRLAYFLWNSPPDAELRNTNLNNPKILQKQAKRLLADSKSRRFVDHFLDQWLDIKDIDFTTPDPQLYPEFDPWLRDSMLEETRAYFTKLVQENRSIDHIIDSDFLLINQRLAELYQLKGVAGSQLKPYKLPPNSPRGGFLTQAAILKVTANGTATSPVIRGAWLSERILGLHLRPPPPNIPAVEPDASGAITIREQIEAHRADPACASCHKTMDPPGMALEHFDVIGTYRENYRAGGRPKHIRVNGKREMEPHLKILTSRGRIQNIRLGGKVDASGKLTNGHQFKDIHQFRHLILQNKDNLATNLARQLTLYATGKGHRFKDRQHLQHIIQQTHKDQHGIQSILQALIQSPLFHQ